MRKQSTAENQDDVFQMQEKKSNVKYRASCHDQQSCHKLPQSRDLPHGWVQRGCTLSSSICLSNNGTVILKAMGIFPLMGFGSSSNKRFKKKL